MKIMSVRISLTREQMFALEDLAEAGIAGSTMAEVAQHILIEGLEKRWGQYPRHLGKIGR